MCKATNRKTIERWASEMFVEHQEVLSLRRRRGFTSSCFCWNSSYVTYVWASLTAFTFFWHFIFDPDYNQQWKQSLWSRSMRVPHTHTHTHTHTHYYTLNFKALCFLVSHNENKVFHTQYNSFFSPDLTLHTWAASLNMLCVCVCVCVCVLNPAVLPSVRTAGLLSDYRSSQRHRSWFIISSETSPQSDTSMWTDHVMAVPVKF